MGQTFHPVRVIALNGGLTAHEADNLPSSMVAAASVEDYPLQSRSTFHCRPSRARDGRFAVPPAVFAASCRVRRLQPLGAPRSWAPPAVGRLQPSRRLQELPPPAVSPRSRSRAAPAASPAPGAAGRPTGTTLYRFLPQMQTIRACRRHVRSPATACRPRPESEVVQ
jgi:hypothetical protein